MILFTITNTFAAKLFATKLSKMSCLCHSLLNILSISFSLSIAISSNFSIHSEDVVVDVGVSVVVVSTTVVVVVVGKLLVVVGALAVLMVEGGLVLLEVVL